MDNDGFVLVRRKGRSRGPKPLGADRKDCAAANPGFYAKSSPRLPPNGRAKTPRRTACQVDWQRLERQDQDFDTLAADEQAVVLASIEKDIQTKPRVDNLDSFFAQCMAVLQDATQQLQVQDIVCYGLGSFAESSDSRLQVRFLQYLADSLQIPGTIYFYDPVLNSAEVAVGRRMSWQWIGENEACKRLVKHTTLFYMPHCEVHMYHNLFETNWSDEQLQHVLIIGNRLDGYLERKLVLV
ncbi:hypothetical protein H4R35_002868 [Dimargaris xerosporica]|nr:hypothetical protein H4R35_002868 [Dimargaris xerosporica]